MDRAIGVQRRDLTGNCSGRDKKLCLFLFVPLTSFSASLFGGLIGFLWLATVPLTSGTGRRYSGYATCQGCTGLSFSVW